jgi:hypothetical protein
VHSTSGAGAKEQQGARLVRPAGIPWLGSRTCVAMRTTGTQRPQESEAVQFTKSRADIFGDKRKQEKEENIRIHGLD